jgi:hypothetical protein
MTKLFRVPKEEDMQVTDSAVNGILQRIDTLAEKLGVTAQYIFGIYVKQAKVTAIEDTLFGLLFFVLTALAGWGAVLLYRYGTKNDKDGYRQTDNWPFATGVLVGTVALVVTVAVVFLIFALISVYGAIGEWVNPQFWAFQQLMKDLHGAQ